MPSRALREPSRTGRLCTALLVAVVLVIGTTAGVNGAIGDTTTDDESPAFDRSVLTVEQFDNATVDVTVPDEEPFDVEFSAQDKPLEFAVTIDPDESTVAVDIDTETVGSEPESALSVENGTLDDFTITETDLESDALAIGSYELHLEANGETHFSVIDVISTVNFVDRPDVSASAIEETPTQTFVGETNLEAGETVDVRLESAEDDPFVVTEAGTVDDDGTFEVPLDLSDAPVETRLDVRFEHDDLVIASATGTIDADDTDDGQSADDVVFVTDGPELELEAAPNQEITGEANLEEGETVRVRLSGTDEPLLIVEDGEVDEHGSFSVGVDVDDIEPGTTVTALAIVDGDQQAEISGIVTEPEADASTGGETAAIDDGDSANDSVIGSEIIQALGAIGVGIALSIIAIVLLVRDGRR